MSVSSSETALILFSFIFAFAALYLFCLHQCVFNRTRDLNKLEDFEEAKKFYRHVRIGLFFPCLLLVSPILSYYEEDGLTPAVIILGLFFIVFLIIISALLTKKEKI